MKVFLHLPFPSRTSGRIVGALGESWQAINVALGHGRLQRPAWDRATMTGSRVLSCYPLQVNNCRGQISIFAAIAVVPLVALDWECC
jgi:hypothetical protein